MWENFKLVDYDTLTGKPTDVSRKDNLLTTDSDNLHRIKDTTFISNLPNSYKFKARKMICHINSHMDTFKWNTAEELIHDGQVIKESQRHDLIQFFIKKNSSPDLAPPGSNKFASLLLESGIPVTSTGDNFKQAFPYYQISQVKKHMWWEKRLR